MEERKRIKKAGSLSLLASEINLAVFGLVFFVVLGYLVLIMSVLGGIASSSGSSSSSEIGGATILMVLIVFGIFVPMIVASVLGLVFGKKLKKMALYNDVEFYSHKKRLVTYAVFMFVFAVFSIAVGVYVAIKGMGLSSDSEGVMAIVNRVPFSLLSAVFYIIAGILLSVDIAKNKEKFEQAKEGKLKVEIAQPQIITIKAGEEIPEELKGRLVPVEKEKEEDKK